MGGGVSWGRVVRGGWQRWGGWCRGWVVKEYDTQHTLHESVFRSELSRFVVPPGHCHPTGQHTRQSTRVVAKLAGAIQLLQCYVPFLPKATPWLTHSTIPSSALHTHTSQDLEAAP